MSRETLNVGDCVRHIHDDFKGVLVGKDGRFCYIKSEGGTTYCHPLSATRKSTHTSRYSKDEIAKAIAHYSRK